MISKATIVYELKRLENINRNALDTRTEQGVDHTIACLEWILEEESTSPFDYFGLEE